jgi:hypothetical protein
MTEQPRCPYCVANDDLRPMLTLSDGGHVCPKCWHIIPPPNSVYVCDCVQCLEFRERIAS